MAKGLIVVLLGAALGFAGELLFFTMKAVAIASFRRRNLQKTGTVFHGIGFILLR
jgi:hypothetical protein